MKFHGYHENLLQSKNTDQSHAHRLTQSLDHWLVFEYGNNNGVGTNWHLPNQILCRAADLNQRLLQETGVCSDYSWSAQPLYMAVCEAENNLWHELLKMFWAICQPLTTSSSRSIQVLTSHCSQVLSVHTFWGQLPAQWALSEKCAKRKYFNSNLCPMQ